MKCFFAGLFGSILSLFAFLFMYAQYSDYIATSEVGDWLARIEKVRLDISIKANNAHSLKDIAVGVSLPYIKNLSYKNKFTRENLVVLAISLS